MKKKTFKEKITNTELMLRFLILTLVATLVYYSDENERQIINLVGLGVAFFVSIYLHKHFFPLMTLTIFMYLVASSQIYWNKTYVDYSLTDNYWLIANCLLILSILNFGYQLIFRYKIVNK